jgi:hypothetical protein
MPVPLVVIEIAPQDLAGAETAPMVAACTEAVGAGRCTLSEGRTDPDATAVAIVSWDSAELRIARIQVGRKRNSGGQWLARSLAFKSADAPVERWRAVGFAIGTLAEEQEKLAESQPAAPSSPARTPASAPRSPATPRGSAPRPAMAWFAVGGLAGPGLTEGAWRGGIFTHAARRIGVTPIYGVASLTWARSPGFRAVSADWVTLALGPGGTYSVPAAQLTFRVQLQAVAQWLRAQGKSDGSSERDDGSRWDWGARAGVQTSWAVHRRIAVLLGIDAWTLTQGVAIRVSGERIAGSPSSGAAGLLGLEWIVP